MNFKPLHSRLSGSTVPLNKAIIILGLIGGYTLTTVANLNKEMKSLQALLETASGAHVVTVTGETLTGKTAFLRHCFRLFQTRNIAYAHFNFERRHNPHSLLDFLADDFGHPSFTEYTATSEEICKLNPSVIVKNTIFALSKPSISSATGADLEDRYRLLARSFVRDLSNLNQKPLIIALDHFEKSTPETTLWLRNELIPRLERIDGLITLIAGREGPRLTLDVAGSHEFTFGAISLPDWKNYRDATGSSLTDDVLEQTWNAAKGIPGKMIAHFQLNQG